MYTLFGDIGSGSSIVELTLCELGIPYQLVNVDLGSDAQRADSYAKVNPQRKVPCLGDKQGHGLTESVAILLTLIERHDHTNKLLPSIGSRDRATALRWLLFVATEIYPIVEINDYPERFCGDDNNPEKTRETAKSIWRKRWLIVEQAISGNPYLLASGFGVTDLYVAVVSRWAQQSEWRPTHIPKIEALTQAVAMRPDCKAVWNTHFG